jgi:hypothetical protein
MTSSDKSASGIDQWIDKKNGNKPIIVNRRKSVRYLRNDIGATVRKIGIFNFVTLKTNRDISVKLIDIGSRGVLVSTDKKLSLNKHVVLTLRFADFKEFVIPSVVVRKADLPKQQYGIKFDQANDKLADYLLATQKKLNFK